MKRTSKKAVSLLLAMLMIMSFVFVSAEETTYKFYDVSADSEATLKTQQAELSGATPASANGQSFVWFNYGNYVVFRANVLEAGIYDISLGWGTASAGAKKFAVTIDNGETKNIAPEYQGLGNYVPEYINVASASLSEGEHTIKVESTGASGAFMAIKLNCIAKAIVAEGISADGVEKIEGEEAVVSADTENIIVELSENINSETVSNETVTLTYGEGQSVAVTPVVKGKKIYVPVKNNLTVGVTYTLTVEGVKDSNNLSTLATLTKEFTVVEKTFTYFNLAESGETTIKALSVDEADRLKPDGTPINSGGGQLSFQVNQEVTFRVNAKTSGIYELLIGIGTTSKDAKKFAVTIDGADPQEVSVVTTIDDGGWKVGEYLSALTMKLDAGKHIIKVKSINASLYLHGIKLGLIEKQIELESLSADGIEEITDANPYVSADTKNLVLKLTSAVNPETVNSENIILTTDGGEVITIAPEVDGKTIYIPVAGELVAGKTYTLIVEGVKDSYNCFDLEEIFANFEVKEKTYTYFAIADNGATEIRAQKVDQADRLNINLEAKALSFQRNQEVTFRLNVETSGVYELFVGLGGKNPSAYTYAITLDDGEPENMVIATEGGSGNSVAEYISTKTLQLDAGKHIIKVKNVNGSVYFHGIKLGVLATAITLANVKADGAVITEEIPYVSADVENITVELSEIIDTETVTAETVMLTCGENETVEIIPTAEGKVVTIPVAGKLESGKEYTLSLAGIKDSYDFTSLAKTEIKFTAYSGSYAGLKYPDVVVEAEDFVSAGYFNGSFVNDANAVSVGTDANGVTYVELDNNDYINIPLAFTVDQYYRVDVVYAANHDSQLSVAGKYQESFPITSDLETYKTHEQKGSAIYYTTIKDGRLMPSGLKEGKMRIDKIILRRGMAVPEDGTVAVRKIVGHRDGQSDNFAFVGSVGQPATLYNGAWGEYVYYFPASGYYNVSGRITTYKGNPLELVLSCDDEVIESKRIVVKDGINTYETANALDIGTYYFEEGYHLLKLQNNGTVYTYAYELLLQKTDLLDGVSVSALDSADYSEGITPNLTTEVAAGQYIASNIEVAEDGYYSVWAMLSSATAAQDVKAYVDDKEFTVVLKKTADLRTIQNTKVADVYLTKGIHTVKFEVPEEGSAIGVHTVSIYAPKIQTAGVPVSEAEVKLNGLFAGKEASAAIAIYKEKDGIKQLVAIDYKNAAVALAATEFDLFASDIIFEDGYTYSAKLFVLSNMAGIVEEFTEE